MELGEPGELAQWQTILRWKRQLFIHDDHRIVSKKYKGAGNSADESLWTLKI